MISNNKLKTDLQKCIRLLNNVKGELVKLVDEKETDGGKNRCVKCYCPFKTKKYGSLVEPSCACGNKIHMECYYESVLSCWQCHPIEGNEQENQNGKNL